MNRSLSVVWVLIAVLGLQPFGACDDDPGPKALSFASHSGNILFLAGGVTGSLLDGRVGPVRALRTADTLGCATGLAFVLKYVVGERRPGHGSTDSFPSGHATAAFAVASMEARYHPAAAPLWYAGATLIAASRVALHRHYIHDVIAGALLGWGTAAWEVSEPHGLLLTPWIGDTHTGAGIALTMRF